MKSLEFISDNFSYYEATHSDAGERLGLINSPSMTDLEIIFKTAVKMEKVRALLGTPIKVNSWFRCPLVNKAVGSTSKNSQHMTGEAVDFVSCRFGSPVNIVKLISANADLINFDQLILEYSWVHISFAILSGKPRNQVLSLLWDKTYAIGITDKKGNPL